MTEETTKERKNHQNVILNITAIFDAIESKANAYDELWDLLEEEGVKKHKDQELFDEDNKLILENVNMSVVKNVLISHIETDDIYSKKEKTDIINDIHMLYEQEFDEIFKKVFSREIEFQEITSGVTQVGFVSKEGLSDVIRDAYRQSSKKNL